MKILFISDLHLGSPLFSRMKELEKLLSSEDFEVIVLCGDIFDIWEANIESIVTKNLEFILLLNILSTKKQVYFIIGNHDPSKEIIKKIFPFVEVLDNLKLKDIFVTHGYEFDDLVIKYSLIAKILFIPHWICQRLFRINLKAYFRNLFYSVSNKKNKNYYNKLVSNIEKEIFNKYKNECRYLVMGHTHLPKIVENEICTYINCGDMIDNHTYVVYNDENKTFCLKEL